jgi:hypothetical protein
LTTLPKSVKALSVDAPIVAAASAKLAPFESHRTKWLVVALLVAMNAVIWWILSRIVRDVAAAIAGATDASHVVQTALRIGLGVALAWLPVRIALRLLNPTVELTLSPAVARFGEPARLEWRLLGRRARVSRLRIWLEGHEAGDGEPMMKTGGRVFHRQPLLDVTGSGGAGTVPEAGELQVIVPEPQPSWPPAARTRWGVFVEVHAPPLPKLASGYKIALSRPS